MVYDAYDLQTLRNRILEQAPEPYTNNKCSWLFLMEIGF